MNQSIKNQYILFNLCLLAALPASLQTKEPIKAKNAQEALMLQTAENQALILQLLAQQQEMLKQQNEALAPILQAWRKQQEIENEAQQHQLQIDKEQRENTRKNQQAFADELSQQLKHWDLSNPTLHTKEYRKLFAQAAILATSYAAGTIAYEVVKIITPNLISRKMYELLADDNLRPIFEYLTATPQDILLEHAAKKHGVNYLNMQDLKQMQTDAKLKETLINELVELTLSKNTEYVHLTEELKKLEQYGNHLIFDEDLRKKHKTILDQMMHLKESTHAEITGGSAR